MPLTLEERDEIIMTSCNLELMIAIRLSIAAKFPRAWIIIHNVENKWGIEVLNNYGQHLTKDKIEEVEFFIEEFMLNYHSEDTEVDKPEEDE